MSTLQTINNLKRLIHKYGIDYALKLYPEHKQIIMQIGLTKNT